ncbi:hypothetical protein NPIL_10201, partial [Nephila pilipes]
PQAPVVVTAVRDGAMWVMGILKLVPQLLPMYMYGLVLWLEEKRKPKKKTDDEKEAKENGAVQKDSANRDHSHENNTHHSNEDSGIDGSISEENHD